MSADYSKAKADAPTVDDKVYHLRLGKGDVPPYMVLPGDQHTTEHADGIWENVREIAYNREYRTVTGLYQGLDMAMTSTGIGDQPAEICINELMKVGVHTAIRVGTADSIIPGLEIGDVIIPTACARRGGAVVHYVPPNFPAFADPRVTKALLLACRRLAIPCKTGVVSSISSWYIGQGRPLDASPDSFFPEEARSVVQRLQNARVIAIDMETAGEFIIGYLHGLRMGAVLSVGANRVSGTWGDNGGEEKALRIASEAIRILRETDTADSVKAL
jgi:uridine phosphorylase